MSKKIKRRDFLKLASTATLAVSAAGLLGSCGGGGGSAPSSKPASSDSEPDSSSPESPADSDSGSSDIPDEAARRRMILLAIENARRSYNLTMPQELARLDGYAENELAWIEQTGSAQNYEYESPFRNGTGLYKVVGHQWVEVDSVNVFTQEYLNKSVKSGYTRYFGVEQEKWTTEAKEVAAAVYVGVASFADEKNNRAKWSIFYAIPNDTTVSADDEDLVYQAFNQLRRDRGWSDAVRVDELDVKAKEDLTTWLETKKGLDLNETVVSAADGSQYKIKTSGIHYQRNFEMEYISDNLESMLDDDFYKDYRYVGIYVEESRTYFDLVLASKV